jgi:hypothetical protein
VVPPDEVARATMRCHSNDLGYNVIRNHVQTLTPTRVFVKYSDLGGGQRTQTEFTIGWHSDNPEPVVLLVRLFICDSNWVPAMSAFSISRSPAFK